MISIQNMTKDYGTFHLHISMEVPAGHITGLIGRNGAGKSTTIKAVLGLVEPDQGVVRVFRKEVSELSGEDKKRWGAALSDSGFSTYLTTSDVAKILSRMYEKCNEQEIMDNFRRFGLPEKKLIKTFSTGMKAKLRVLTAMQHKPDLLVLDEPTAGLDVEARNEILDLLREYLAENENRSILITSHIATDLEGLCDDIYLIDGGQVLLHEDTDVILSDYALLKAEEEVFERLDRRYLLAVRKEQYGCLCLTKEKQFYRENYPGLIMERCGIDDLILLMKEGNDR